MKIRIFFWSLLLTVSVSARSSDLEEFEDVKEPHATQQRPRDPDRKPSCNEFAFGQGCSGFSLGPVLSSDSKGIVYGAGAGYTYFVLDRLGLGVSGGAIFGSGYQDYSVGPGLTYYIGPFSGYLLTPSFSVSRHFLRGDLNVEGWAYGPSLGLMTNLFGGIYWGVSVGYFTFQVEGYKSSDWNFSPIVFIPF